MFGHRPSRPTDRCPRFLRLGASLMVVSGLLMVQGCERPETPPTAEPAGAEETARRTKPVGASDIRVPVARTMADSPLGSAAALTDAPPVDVVPPFLDFGFIPPNVDATGSVKIVNQGTEPLMILAAEPSCKCTTLSDLSWLAHLPRLRHLQITSGDLEDLSPLARVPQLQSLHLRLTVQQRGQFAGLGIQVDGDRHPAVARIDLLAADPDGCAVGGDAPAGRFIGHHLLPGADGVTAGDVALGFGDQAVDHPQFALGLIDAGFKRCRAGGDKQGKREKGAVHIGFLDLDHGQLVGLR